eukprot:3250034-Prymnesium_polylepis.1
MACTLAWRTHRARTHRPRAHGHTHTRLHTRSDCPDRGQRAARGHGVRGRGATGARRGAFLGGGADRRQLAIAREEEREEADSHAGAPTKAEVGGEQQRRDEPHARRAAG